MIKRIKIFQLRNISVYRNFREQVIKYITPNEYNVYYKIFGTNKKY